MNYFNTTEKTGDDLKQSEVKATSQEVRIREYFELFPDKEFTPCQILENLRINAPLTSVRRAMSNLTDKGILIKTGNKRMGIYGQFNFTWKLKVHTKTGQVNLGL